MDRRAGCGGGAGGRRSGSCSRRSGTGCLRRCCSPFCVSSGRRCGTWVGSLCQRERRRVGWGREERRWEPTLRRHRRRSPCSCVWTETVSQGTRLHPRGSGLTDSPAFGSDDGDHVGTSGSLPEDQRLFLTFPGAFPPADGRLPRPGAPPVAGALC